MTDRELLEAMYKDMQSIKQDIQGTKHDVQCLQQDMQSVKQDVQCFQQDMQSVKQDVQCLQQDMQSVKQDIQGIKQNVTSLELRLENETNHNIQLLAENHMNLTDKLNQAIRVSDKTLLYEVQVSTLKSKVESLEKEIADIKSKIA